MIDILISDPFVNDVEPQLLEAAVKSVLSHQDTPSDSEITVLIEGDDRIQELNLQFMGIDAPTDVLSFPSTEIDPETGNLYLGDIIISFPRALSQAKADGHPIESELQLLVVHGTLHLLGFDHAEEEDKRQMWSVQEKILSDLGVKLARYSDE
jgi:probable rRNA maturation factor